MIRNQSAKQHHHAYMKKAPCSRAFLHSQQKKGCSQGTKKGDTTAALVSPFCCSPCLFLPRGAPTIWLHRYSFARECNAFSGSGFPNFFPGARSAFSGLPTRTETLPYGK